jgi:hypothetical protein
MERNGTIADVGHPQGRVKSAQRFDGAEIRTVGTKPTPIILVRERVGVNLWGDDAFCHDQF